MPSKDMDFGQEFFMLQIEFYIVLEEWIKFMIPIITK